MLMFLFPVWAGIKIDKSNERNSKYKKSALYFETHFLEFKMVLDQWFELVHDGVVSIDVLSSFLATF